MKIAYLILTHNKPKNLRRLIETLNTNLVSFFVHVDVKSNIREFYEVTEDVVADINYCKKRENGQWGALGIVKATLNLIREAHCIGFDHYVLLSGADYPIKSNKQIQQFFELHKHESFISYEKIPTLHLNYEGLDRTQGYSYTINKIRQTFVPYKLHPVFNVKGHILNFFLGVYSLLKKRRTTPAGIHDFYYGSQWWMLNSCAISYILSFLENHPDYVKFHQHTLLPDEIFFQTILLNNSKNNKCSLCNDDMRYIVWDNDSSHPKVLQTEDYESILNSACLFARKVDYSSSLLSKIENNILSC